MNILKENNLTISAAESCTGGYLSYLLTQLPGSSAVFKGGLVTYSLEAKNSLLGINKKLLEHTQGISAEVALQLSEKTAQSLNSDIATAIVGAAGPGSVNKIPTGTVFIAVHSRKKTCVKKFIFTGSRSQVRKQAAYTAINQILSVLSYF